MEPVYSIWFKKKINQLNNVRTPTLSLGRARESDLQVLKLREDVELCQTILVGTLPLPLLSLRTSLCYSFSACWVAQLFLTLRTFWTVAFQTPLSMGFFRQEYWSGLLFPTPGDLPNPGTEPMSSTLQADSSPSETPGKPENPYTWPKPSSLTFHLRQWRLREVQKLTQRSTLMSPPWVTILMVLNKIWHILYCWGILRKMSSQPYFLHFWEHHAQVRGEGSKKKGPQL